MAARNPKRDEVKAAYIERKAKGQAIVLKDLAAEFGVAYDLLRRWKQKDEWEKSIPRKRGAQPGNTNSKGHKNAKGNKGGGAPKRNSNAGTHGGYSTLFFDNLTDRQKQLIDSTPTEAVPALRHELQVLKLREDRLLHMIAEAENAPQDSLQTAHIMDMRVPGKGGKGERSTMRMVSQDTPFARAMKLQEALTRLQGRIAAVTTQMRAAEENEARMEMERQKLEIMRARLTGAVEIPDPEDEDAPPAKGTVTEFP